MRVPPTSRFRSVAVAALSAAVFGGCAASGAGAGALGEASSASSTRVERRELDRHPPISLVVREGDPFPAMAFASARPSDAVASVVLSALIAARLAARGIVDLVSVPTEAGFELAALCPNPAAARAFIEQVTAALALPITERDPALPKIEEALSALRGRVFNGRAEAALADCSGDLGIAPATVLPDARTAAGRAELDKYRQIAFSARSSAFGALGPTGFVDAAARELAQVADWPSGAAVEDAWPGADLSNVDSAEGRRHLSVALRVASADRALASLSKLSATDADLGSRLSAFAPGFSVERVAFLARPRGACVRVDLSLPEGDPSPSLNEVAQAASIVSDELRAALVSADPGRALDENIIRQSDPREAALRAAWRGLSGRLEAGPERRLVALSVHPAESAAFVNLTAALAEFETRPVRAALEAKIRSEPGQGEFWLLVGSPCGTLSESNQEAGQSALALTLAAQSATPGVALEPWLTADAVGLLAHAPRLPGEGAEQQAERVARSLARAFSDHDASGSAFATAQGALFSVVGRQPRPGYERLLDALSPDHSAWLEPRGTWATLSQANRDSVGARGRDLLRGPLRVAVLTNQDERQGAVAVHSLERWLAPWREDPRRCQATAERSVKSGEITLATSGDPRSESAYVGLPFPSRLKFDREAEAVVALLNEPNGALAHALDASHITASAHASVIGGGRVAALVVEIHAQDDEARRAAIEVRRALSSFSQGALSAPDFAAAERSVARRALTAALDPRRRIVDLWRGSEPKAELGPVGLRAFQATLAAAAQVVVYVTHED